MLDMVTTGLYILLPLVFSGVMAWVGVKGNEAWKGFNDAGQPISSAGGRGSSIAFDNSSTSAQKSVREMTRRK